MSFPSVISFAPNTTYYGQFVRTFAFIGENPQFTTGLHPSPSGFGYFENDPPYNGNSVFYDTSNIGPSVITLPATSITSSGAQLNGTVSANGASSGIAYFEYWSDQSLGISSSTQVTLSASLGNNTTVQSLSFLASELQSGLTYSYRMVFYDRDNGNTTYGATQRFVPFTRTAPNVVAPPPAIGGKSTVTPVVFVAEPINTANGDYYYSHDDLRIAEGRGLRLTFTRTYNSLDPYSGPLGANWTHEYNVTLGSTATGVVIKWGDGHGESFTFNGSGFVPQAGVHSSLTQNLDGSFSLLRTDQVGFNFSSTGVLTNISDRNGNIVVLSYDSSNNLIQVADAVGRAFTLAYDGLNRISQVTDPIGRTISYGYDANDNLISVTDALGGVAQYEYDSAHHVAKITQPNGAVLAQNGYDMLGRVVAQTNGRGFTWTFAYGTPGAGQTTITDARGNQTIHAYDSSLRIVGITDALGGTTSYTYDDQNNRTSATDANGHTSQFNYDAEGNLITATDPLGNSRQLTYDGMNNLLTATTPLGNITQFAYDSRGNPASTTDPQGSMTQIAYDSFGEPTSRTDGNGKISTFSHDSSGNLVKITDPVGNARTMIYDGDSRLLSTTDANGHTSSVMLDDLDRATKALDPLGNATQFAYDAVSNLVKLTDPNNHATFYGYDANNDLVSVTDVLSHVTQYGYDQNNNRTAFTNAKGNTSAYAYDALNRIASSADPLGNTTAYAYDHAGNLSSTTDGNGVTNRFTYDAANRLTGIAYGDGSTVAYAYDADGRRTSMADSTGLTQYAYDKSGRLLTVTNPASQVVRYSYDAAGNRASLTYPDGKIVSYIYDGANRMSEETDWVGRNTTYTYDSANNVTRIGYPTGAGVSFIYDNANRLTKVSNTTITGTMSSFAYTLDAAGNRVAITSNGLIKKYGYDALNELISQTQGTQITGWTYDPVGNRLQQVTPTGTTAYTYDAADRLLSATGMTFTYDSNGSQLSKTTAAGNTTYAYNAARQLASVIGPGVNSSFTYDGDGNRVMHATAAGTYAYVNDIATALTVVLNEAGPEGNIDFAYGLNLIEEQSSAFNYFYQFDGLSSVAGLTDANGRAVTAYAYDAWGNATSSGTVGLKNKFRFTGEELDPNTGLYYLRARYYDPSAGRLLTSDLFGGNDKLPLTGNRYGYALGNPVRNTDPSGFTTADMSTGQGSLSEYLLRTGNAGTTLDQFQHFKLPVVGPSASPSSQFSLVWAPTSSQPANTLSTRSLAPDLSNPDAGVAMDVLKTLTSPGEASEIFQAIVKIPLPGADIVGIGYLGIAGLVQLEFWLQSESMFEHPAVPR